MGRDLGHQVKELWPRKWRKTSVLAWHKPCEFEQMAVPLQASVSPAVQWRGRPECFEGPTPRLWSPVRPGKLGGVASQGFLFGHIPNLFLPCLVNTSFLVPTLLNSGSCTLVSSNAHKRTCKHLPTVIFAQKRSYFSSRMTTPHPTTSQRWQLALRMNSNTNQGPECPRPQAWEGRR